MLDELLGRRSLKDRIDELEEQLEHRGAQLEAERERRADAASDRQAAEERVNRLEDRIADLEGQLERARDGERVVDYRSTQTLRRGRIAGLLDRIETIHAPPEGAVTAYVDGTPPDTVRDLLGERTALVDRAAPCLVIADDAGIVAAALEPPRPPASFLTRSDRFEVDRAWFEPRGTFGFAVVRSDLFAYGAYDDETRVDYEGFESDVMAAHSKGGYSQARFERRRDDQIDVHLDRCREALVEREADPLIVVGQRTLLGEFADLADHTATADATGAPESALEDAFADFWTTTVHGL